MQPFLFRGQWRKAQLSSGHYLLNIHCLFSFSDLVWKCLVMTDIFLDLIVGFNIYHHYRIMNRNLCWRYHPVAAIKNWVREGLVWDDAESWELTFSGPGDIAPLTLISASMPSHTWVSRIQDERRLIFLFSTPGTTIYTDGWKAYCKKIQNQEKLIYLIN